MGEVRVVKANPGETGSPTWRGKLPDGVSEDRALKLAELIAAGVTDDEELMRECRMSAYTLSRALRSTAIQQVITATVKAEATLAMAETVKGSIDDMRTAKTVKERMDARRYIRDVHEGPRAAIVNQTNHVSEWDPAKDEALYERAKDFFSTQGKRIIADTVDEVAERMAQNSLGEGESDTEP
jgi:mRNA degradation ribonuclease J1/J2